jgi:hypothetical protein
MKLPIAQVRRRIVDKLDNQAAEVWKGAVPLSFLSPNLYFLLLKHVGGLACGDVSLVLLSRTHLCRGLRRHRTINKLQKSNVR